MLILGPNLPMFVYAKPADMRKGCHRLAAIVREEFHANPQDGSLFLFFNKRRDRLKILYFDGTGYWVEWHVVLRNAKDDIMFEFAPGFHHAIVLLLSALSLSRFKSIRSIVNAMRRHGVEELLAKASSIH